LFRIIVGLAAGEDVMPSEQAANTGSRTPPEFATLMAHYYRGELSRMVSWRDRIDRTSNWAITVVAAILSLSLSTPDSHHGILLFAMLVVSLLLWIEARRYRFFDVYRARVRLLERGYIAPALTADHQDSLHWRDDVATSLRRPIFFMGIVEALSRRLRRNYIWMYTILLLAWILKISTPRLQDETTRRDVARTLEEILANAALGALPGWLILVCTTVLFVAVAVIALRANPDDGELAHGEVHV
jgi:uncharacterized membrane protein